MTAGVSARVVAVCTLLCGVTIAHADRRPVAVVDLAGDPAPSKLAQDENPVLLGHPDLQPIPDPSIPAELYGPFRDDDQERITNALNAKVTAEERLGRFELQVAEESTKNGQEELGKATPSVNVLVVYGQLSFIRAQALLGTPTKAARAREFFALAHRLDPAFVPDASRYLPDVVQAFEAAKKAWSGKGTLAVGGTGRLWLDGKELGTAPTELEVDAGPHVVWLTGAERETRSEYVVVDTGKPARVVILDAPADLRLKVRRARAALRYAPDAAARAPAMLALAELVNVKDALLLSSANGKVIWQTWTAKDGFSALHELKREKPIDLLAPLAPPRPAVEDTPPGPGPKIDEDPERWYQRRSVRVSAIVVGVVAAIVASYYIYQAATDDTVTWEPDVSPAGRLAP